MDTDKQQFIEVLELFGAACIFRGEAGLRIHGWTCWNETMKFCFPGEGNACSSLTRTIMDGRFHDDQVNLFGKSSLDYIKCFRLQYPDHQSRQLLGGFMQDVPSVIVHCCKNSSKAPTPVQKYSCDPSIFGLETLDQLKCFDHIRALQLIAFLKFNLMVFPHSGSIINEICRTNLSFSLIIFLLINYLHVLK